RKGLCSVHSRQLDVKQHQVRIVFPPKTEPLPCIESCENMVALALEIKFQSADKRVFIIYQQDLFHIGKLKTTTVPAPTSLETEMPNPWASIIFLTMESPKPVPCSLVVKNGWKMRFISCCEIPGPLSETSIRIPLSPSSPAALILISTFPAGPADSSAFLITFTSTCRICSGSPVTSAREPSVLTPIEHPSEQDCSCCKLSAMTVSSRKEVFSSEIGLL